MTKLGFSLDYSYDTTKHIDDKFDKAYEYVFLKMPNTNELVKLQKLCQYCHQRHLKIIVDSSYQQLSMISKDPIQSNIFLNCCIDFLRLDDGFDIKQCKEIVRKYAANGIALNASRLSMDNIEEWQAFNKPLIAIHNYYPGKETGLSANFVSSINYILEEKNIQTLVFANAQGGICSTFEDCKLMSSGEICDYLKNNVYASGCLIGDPNVDGATLSYFARSLQDCKLSSMKSVSSLTQQHNDEKQIEVEILTQHRNVLNKLFNDSHTMRNDHPSFCLRSMSSRMVNGNGETIDVENTVERPKGCITIENKLAGRYSGEIRVIMSDLPMSNTSNVIGLIHESIDDLSDYKKIKFIERKFYEKL